MSRVSRGAGWCRAFFSPQPPPAPGRGVFTVVFRRARDRSARDRASPTTPLVTAHTLGSTRSSLVRSWSHHENCTAPAPVRVATFACVANRNSNTAPGTARGVAPRVEQHGCWENEDMTHKKAANAQSSCPLRFWLSSLPLSLATRRALAPRHRHQLAWGWTQLVPKLVPQLVPSNSGRNRRPSLSRPPLPKLRESPGTTHSRPS